MERESYAINRARLFAVIEHVERVNARNLGRSPRSAPATPRARAEALFASPEARPTLTATPAALATAAQRAKRTTPPTVSPPPRRDAKTGAVRLSAKTMKATVVLDAAAVGQIQLPSGALAPPLVVEVGGHQVHTPGSAKGLRKGAGYDRRTRPGSGCRIRARQACRRQPC